MYDVKIGQYVITEPQSVFRDPVERYVGHEDEVFSATTDKEVARMSILKDFWAEPLVKETCFSMSCTTLHDSTSL